MEGRHAAPSDPPIVFGPFVLDRRRGRLRRGAEDVALRHKAWDVLCHLASRPGVLVPNADLLDAAWPGVHVTPQTLTNVIRELRLALDDRARAPRFIRTVRGRGHVFVWRAEPPAPAGGARREPVPVVGRDAELRRLQALWHETLGGGARVAFVSGAPGIGKTTLVEAAVRAIAGEGGAVRLLRGACLEQHGAGEAYLPLLAAVDHLVDAEGRRVVACLRRFAPTWLAQVPWRLGARERQRLERELAGTIGVRMLREGVALVRALAEPGPMVLVVEDLQWSDRPTLDLLAAVARRPPPVPLLVLCTFRLTDGAGRPAPVVPRVQELVRAGLAAELALEPFDAAAVRDYLDARFGAGVLPPELALRLEEHCAGTPLFLCALVDQLVARGAIQRTALGWHSTAAESLAIELPQSLRDFVLSEFDATADGIRDVVAAASVVGAAFTPAEVSAAVGRTALEVESACDALARTGRLVRADGEVAGPDGRPVRRYAFVHAAHRKIVYDAVGPLRRQALHAAVAAGLEAVWSGRADRAGLLAAHFQAGGAPAKAVEYLERAAANAERRFAYRESATYLRAALQQLDGAAAPRAGGLYLRLAGMLAVVEGYGTPAVGDALTRARALFAGPGAARALFAAEMGLARHALSRAENDVASGHVARLLEISRAELPEVSASACLWAGFAASSLGDLPRARALLEAGAAAPRVPGITAHQDVHRMITSQLALVLAVQGEVERAQGHAEAALARSRRRGRALDLAHACLQATEYALFVGDRAAARATAREAIAPATEVGLTSWLVTARFYNAMLDEARSRADAVREMRAALADRRALGDRWWESVLLGLLAETELSAGDVAGARATLDEAQAHVARTRERHYLPELLRMRGGCARAAGGPGAEDEAGRWFAEAVSVARGLGARLWEEKAARSRGEGGGDRARSGQAATWAAR